MLKQNVNSFNSYRFNSLKLFNTGRTITGRKRQPTKSTKPKVKKKRTLFPCPQCGKRFVSPNYLKAHKNRRGHIENWKLKEFQCGFCLEVFPGNSALRGHEERLHRQGGKYSCSVCPTTFDDSDFLVWHQRKHPKKMQFMCSYCDTKFVYYHKFLAHEKRFCKSL